MSEQDDFEKCVIESKVGGRTSLKCRLGLWAVMSTDSDSVYLESYRYWRQYRDDGEYHEIIGGKSPIEML